MDNGDAAAVPAAADHTAAAQGLQQQVDYLQRQLQVQNRLFQQQQAFLQLQAQHLQAMHANN